AGISGPKLEELFPGILTGLDIDLIQKVKLQDRIVPPHVLWSTVVPRVMASNNWVISGAKTASGKPILANDPHLEVNRLPNVWYELVLETEKRYVIGATMPGLPGMLIGRTPDLAWGATYTFMDSVDSWIEKCKAGQFYYKKQWHDFKQRKELIKRKKKSDVEIVFFENDHGVLDGDPYRTGYYLSTLWSGAHSGATSINQIVSMLAAQNVQQGMDILGQLETSWNWLLADQQGNIGYQMSGLMPIRREDCSGFVPLPGWDPENDWHGFVHHEDLPRCYNPEQGYLTTANQDLNHFSIVKPINLPMGPYRADRISELLAQGDNFSIEDMFPIQYDVYSRQAEAYLNILRALLPASTGAAILKKWDCRYTPQSQGAYLFEQFYSALFQEVFGKHGVGVDVVTHLFSETGIMSDFYLNFDRILLASQSQWFDGEDRDTLYSRVLTRILDKPFLTWGERQQVMLSNILLGGKVPRILGFDRGPLTLRGGRATINQGQIYKSAGRTTTFAPSFRTVTDMARDECFTNMAGGPSDRRFSKWYCSDLKHWRTGEYKRLSPGD
ncbi:penicillin acylase family protein, partial [candidate division CSSED10-310 bacterium]